MEQYKKKGHVNTTLCSALSLARAPGVCYCLVVAYANLYIRNTLIMLHTGTESAVVAGVVPCFRCRLPPREETHDATP